MMKAIRSWLAAAGLCLLGLAGCGGGSAPSAYTVTLDTSAVTLGGESGVTSASVTARYSGAGVVVGTLPGQDLPTWLTVAATSTSAGSATFSLSADSQAAEMALPGRYTTTLRFVTGNADGSGQVYTDLGVTYDKTIVVDQASVSLVGAAGGGTTSSTTLGVYSMGTEWIATADQPWIVLTQVAGVGHDQLVVAADFSGQVAGTLDGTVTISDVATGVPRHVPVHAVVEAPELVLRRTAAALVSIGSYQSLAVSLPTADNGGSRGLVGWRAAADQPWVSIGQAGGVSGQPLELAADTTGLADGQYFANVTVTPDSGPVQTVRLGLLVDRTSTPVSSLNIGVLQNTNGTPSYAFVPDPVRPYGYYVAGDWRINVYHLYTGALLKQFSVTGAHFGAAAVSPDGRTLYVANQATRQIQPVDLETLTLGTPVSGPRIAWQGNAIEWSMGRVGTRAVLVTSGGQIVDPVTGDVLVDVDPGVPGSYFAHSVLSNDGRLLAVQEASNANHAVARWRISVSGATMSAIDRQSIMAPGDGGGIAFVADDSMLVATTPGAYVTGATDVVGYPGGDLGRPSFLQAGRGERVAPRADGGFYVGCGQFGTITLTPAGGGAAVTTQLASDCYASLGVSGDQRRLLFTFDGSPNVRDLP